MPPYHSSIPYNRCLGNIPILPLRITSRATSTRGPAPQPADPTQPDIVDLALDVYKANIFFSTFEIKERSDLLLVYVTLYVGLCLKRLVNCPSREKAVQEMLSLSVDCFALPGEDGFPLNSLFHRQKSESDADELRRYLTQVRSEAGQRLVQRVFDPKMEGEDGKPDSKDDLDSTRVLNALETIDDDCDRQGIALVKIDDDEFAQEYGVDKIPSLVYFEEGIPHLYQGNLASEDEVLGWLIHQMKSDEIEEVTDQMLERLVEQHEHVAVVIYDKEDRMSERVLEGLETIDDELGRNHVLVVKMMSTPSNNFSALQITNLPAIVFYDNKVPTIFDGDETREGAVMDWILKESVDEDGDGEEKVKEAIKEASEAGAPGETLNTIKTSTSTEELPSPSPGDRSATATASESKLVTKMPSKKKGVLEGISKGRAAKVDMTKSEVKIQVQGKSRSHGDPEEAGTQVEQPRRRRVKRKEKVTQAPDDSDAKGKSRVLRKKARKAVDQEDLKPQSRTSKETERVTLNRKTKVTKPKASPGDPASESSSKGTKVKGDPEGIQTEEILPRPTRRKAAKVVAPAAVKRTVKTSKTLKEDEKSDVARKRKERMAQDQVREVDSVATKPRRRRVKTTVRGDNYPDEDEEPLRETESKEPAVRVSEEAEEIEGVEEVGEVEEIEQIEQIEVVEETEEMYYDDSKSDDEVFDYDDYQAAESEKEDDLPEVEEEYPANVIEDSPNVVAVFSAKKTSPEEAPSSGDIPAKGEASAEDSDLKDKAEVIKSSDNLVVLFYEHLDKVASKIISGLERVEAIVTTRGSKIRFLHIDINDVVDVSVTSVPSIVYFKNGEPIVYDGNLMNEENIRIWAEAEYKTNQDVIEDLSTTQIRSLVAENDHVLVFVYQANCNECSAASRQLEEIDDDVDAVGAKFVKTDDASFITDFGVSDFPTIMYFEKQNPSIYEGDPTEENELLTWLLYQMKEDTIENINRELLFTMVEKVDFLAVFFYLPEDEDSAKMLRHLELIDDEAADYGVRMVKLEDQLMSKKYGHRIPPGLGYFRQGNYIKYDGDIFDSEEILDWLTDPNVMEISDQIEKVNRKMFEKLKIRNENLVVLFYTTHDCKQCDHVSQVLESIDDEAEAAGVPIVKLEDRQLAKTIGVFAHPSIVIFRNYGKDAVIYSGDLKSGEAILEWLVIQKDPNNEAIEDMEGDVLLRTIHRTESVAIFVYKHDDCPTCLSVLQSLENIDDDTERQQIRLLKTTDTSFARRVGLVTPDSLPALVLFSRGVPAVFEGDLAAEEEVLDWLIDMKVDSHIELITRAMLEDMMDDVQYMAVFFYKQNCRTCDQVLAELEKIDDDCDKYGIQMVKLQDPQLAKRYGIKTFPALVYFRNGNPLTYDGDLKNEQSVLEWLVDDDNRELDDQIEAVNYKMLEKLMETSPFLAVFFYDEDCIECESILEGLENIDDDADAFGIDFVKNREALAAKQYNVYTTPALVYFRKKTPILFDGDLHDEEKVLTWLTSQDVFEIKDEIEEVNRKMLEKLLDENDFVAVFFFDHPNNCASCARVLEGLETIDSDTDALDITFVKVNDHRYAKKYGVNKLPALVYFRKRFPSIYRDDLLKESDVLEWLKKNRFKHMELDLFMYTIIAIAVTFVFYTLFLLFGFMPKEKDKNFDLDEATK